MKKIIPILIMLFILALAFQLVLTFFIKSHNIKYSVLSNNISYTVEEKFYKDTYDFIIKDKNSNIYNYSYKYNFNKQDRIIKDIKTYKSNNITCIVPIYKRNQFDNIYCNYKDKVYSYSYLRDNNFSISDITKDIKSDGYYKDNLNETNNIKADYNNNYFIGNVPDNYRIIMWNYTGLDIVDNKNMYRKVIYDDKDLYDNDYSTMVGRYYVILDKDTANEITFYNIEEFGKGHIVSDYQLSGDYVILGSYKNKLYIVDLDNYVEYTINPYMENIKQIGDEKTGYKGFVNNELKKINTSDFKSNIEKYKLTNKVEENKITKKFNTTDIRKTDNYYYFKDNNNNFYRSVDKYKTKPTLLFRLNEVSEWKLLNHNILVISDNMLYLYNDDYGLKKIILNNEFRYKYKNMYDLWYK